MFGVPAARIIRCRVISRRMRLGARVSVILDESILEGREREGGGGEIRQSGSWLLATGQGPVDRVTRREMRRTDLRWIVIREGVKCLSVRGQGPL